MRGTAGLFVPLLLLAALCRRAAAQPGGDGPPTVAGGVNITFMSAPASVTVGVPFDVQVGLFEGESGEPLRYFPSDAFIDFTAVATGEVSLPLAGNSAAAYTNENDTFLFQDVVVGAAGELVMAVYVADDPTFNYGGRAETALSSSVGAAAGLIFQSSTTYFITGGSALTPPPTFALVDIGGNQLVNDNSSNALLQFTANVAPEGSTSPSFPLSLSLVDGSATAGSITFYTAGSYEVVVSLPSAPGVATTTVQVSVTEGTATHITITQHPADKLSAEDNPVVVAVIRDDGENPAASADVVGAVLRVLDGPTRHDDDIGSAEHVDGVLTFDTWEDSDQLRIAGEYVLAVIVTMASSASMTATCTPFEVLVGEAAYLSFGVQPGSALPGLALSVMPVLDVLDHGMNLVTNFTGDPVVLTLASGSGELHGTTTAAFVNGTADFSGVEEPLSVSATGAFQLAAETGQFSVESDVFYGLIDIEMGMTDDWGNRDVTFGDTVSLTLEALEAPESPLVLTPVSDAASFSPSSVELAAGELTATLTMTADLSAGAFLVTLAVDGDERFHGAEDVEWSASCPTGYVGAACSICAVHYYHEDGSTACSACPENALCDGGDAPPSPNEGFWSSITGRVDHCIPHDACLGSFGNDTCAPGYTDVRCSSCEVDFYRFRTECFPCPADAELRYGMLVLIVVVAFWALYLGYRWLYPAMEAAGPVVSIAIDFCQILAVFSSYTFWPPRLLDMMEGSSFSNMNVDLLAVECTGLGFDFKWLVAQLTPVVFGVLAPAAVYGVSLLLRRGGPYVLDRCVAASLLVLQLVYLTSTTRTLSLFDCVEFEGTDEAVMEAIPSEYCVAPFGSGAPPGEEGKDDVHSTLLPWGVVTLLVYTMGIPLLFFAVLKWHIKVIRTPDRGFQYPGTLKRYGVLFRRFDPDHWYWILVVMGRKLLVAYASAIMSDDPSSQLALMAFVIVFSLVVQVRQSPYATPRLLRKRPDRPLLVDINLLESSQLVCCFCILLSGITFNSDVDRSAWSELAIEVLMLAIVVITSVYFAYMLTWIVHATAKQSTAVRRASLVHQESVLQLPGNSSIDFSAVLQERDDEIVRLRKEVETLRKRSTSRGPRGWRRSKSSSDDDEQGARWAKSKSKSKKAGVSVVPE